MTDDLLTLPEYRTRLRKSAYLFWRGDLNYLEFMNAMYRIVDKGFRSAWARGLDTRGINVDEMTDEEHLALAQEIANDTVRINRLAGFIEQNRKDRGGKRSALYPRLNLWTDAYIRVREHAKAFAKDNPKLKWATDGSEQCASCKKLSGKVKRASFWREQEVFPKSWSKLLCRQGCTCTLQPTDEPLTPGPLAELP